MFLSELEINGFKSFAGNSKFKFSDGITAIVGPNGCGKSNIVDAVRWVLGEQKTSVLRSDSMENVIFNGTSQKKPLGMAEVKLKLENNKHVLPSEYDTVQIARRLFRDGESNYLLNNTKCRLKDINDLFMDTGMGADSYSVIELKMVEALINGKMDERRKLIEEAAGVTRYKQRRKEAHNKLIKVQEDLERVNDIISEVDANVKRLSRQAKKTKRYNELSEELKEIETKLLKNEYAGFKQNNKQLIEKIEELNKSLSTLNEEQDNIETDLTSVREKKSELDEKISGLQNEENKHRSELSESERITSVNTEKRSSLESTNRRLAEENKFSEEAIEKLSNELENIKAKLEKRELELEEQSNSLKDSKAVKEEKYDKLQYAKELAGSNQETLNKLKNSIQSSYSIIENNEKRIDNIKSKIESYESEIKQSSDKKEDIINELKELENNLKIKSGELEDSDQEFEKSQNQLESLNEELSQLSDNISEIKNKLSGKKAQLEFLKNLSTDDNTTQLLLESDEWDKPGDISVLSELISVDDEYKDAVSSLIGDFKNLIVVESRNQAESAFELLSKKDLSKRSLICKELVPEIDFSKNRSPEGTSDLLDKIEADNSVKNILKTIFGFTVLAESKEAALKAVNSGNVNTAVTKEGFIVSKSGILRGGGSSKKDIAALGRKKRISETTKDIEKLEKQLNKVSEQRSGLLEERDKIDLDKIKAEVKNKESELSSLKEKKLQQELKTRSIDNNIEMYSENIENSKKELSGLKDEIDDLNNSIEEHKSKLKDAESNKEEKLDKLNKAEKEYDKINEELQAIEILKIQIESDVRSLRSDLERTNNQISSEKQKLKVRKENIIENDKTISNIEIENKELDNKIELLKKDLNELLSKKEQFEDKRKDLNEQMVSLTNELHRKRSEFNKVREEHHKLDIKRNELETKMENLENRAFEAYEIYLQDLELEIDEEFSIEENKKHVNEIKQKLVNLGNINFEAVQEYDEQNERLHFLNKQVSDLVEAEKTLLETIDEINVTAEARFEETFSKIKENFSMLFKKLFNDEAVADIKLSDENILESDIEIIAKPPGKKPRNIDMLSGGEKTLTAIALLFAIYLVKPSPFCILDEVDAPLDDANLKRFNSLIKEFSKNTQFIVVTHMKITMEAADTLYGITQQEVGVSKIVSVKLKKDEVA